MTEPLSRPAALAALALVGASFLGVQAAAADEGKATFSLNDFGGTGLLQTPTGRTAPDGQIWGGVSYISPYTRYFLTVQGLPWIEATLRYTDISNRLYGPEEFSGRQSYKDRSFDLKLRLLQETASFPAVSVGFRDIGGTGLFQSEYLAASKSVGNFDVSFGFGWGNLATRGHFPNPLRMLGSGFGQRRGPARGGGALDTDFFRGERMSLFGGVVWRTPVPGLSLKLEYDPNTYQAEPLENKFRVEAPVNVGLEYRYSDWLHMDVGVERGNRIMVRLATTTNLNERSTMPKIDPPPLPPRPPLVPAAAPATSGPSPGVAVERPATPAASLRTEVASLLAVDGMHLVSFARVSGEVGLTIAGSPIRDSVTVATEVATRVAMLDPDYDGKIKIVLVEYGVPWLTLEFAAPGLREGRPAPAAGPDPVQLPAFQFDASLRKQLSDALRTQGSTLLASSVDGDQVTLFVAQGRYRQLPKAIGRIARAAAATLPSHFKVFRIVFVEGGIEMVAATVARSSVEGPLVAGRGSLEEAWLRTELERPQETVDRAQYQDVDPYPGYNWSIRPALRQTLGRPEAFVLYQLWARLNGSVDLAPGLSANGSLGVNIYNNFDRMRVPSDSVLPRVRSDIKNYLQQGTTGLTHAQVDYNFRIAGDLYGHVYGGLLEEMFGGVGAETLYRPFGSNWAVGFDVNWVKQRDFGQWLEFRDYDVVTGHAAFYYHYEPLALDARIRLGRYLAKDVGATFEVSRTFDSGIVVGAFATFTDVPPEKFGEGRFDKGIYVSVPLDQIFVRSSRGAIGWLWRPLTRDGGQALVIRRPLIGTTDASSASALRRDWNLMFD